MYIEMIGWAYVPTPKEVRTKECHCNSFEDFRKNFLEFYIELQELNENLDISSVIETRANVGDKQALAAWREQVANEIFMAELNEREVEYA